MSTTLDQERREFAELCLNNPNYPRDFELHKMYQSHIKKWKPLIESNDPSIYSDWDKYTYQYWKDERFPLFAMLDFLVDNPLLDRSGFPILYGDFRKYRFLDRSRIDLNMITIRLRMIRFLFDSYVYMIEHQPGSYVKKFRIYRHIKPTLTVSKKMIVRGIDDIAELGYNPFDMMYYTTTDSYRTGQMYKTVGFIFAAVGITLLYTLLSILFDVWNSP